MADALDYFNIRPPGTPLSQFFPQQGGDDAFRAQLEERPQAGAGLPPEVALAYQTSDPQGFLGQLQQQRAGIQSQRIIKNLQDLDFGSKDYSPSVAKLLSKNSLGASDPAVQNILKLKALSGTQARDRNLNDQAASAMKQFYSLDPSDPDYPEKHQKWVESLDPSVLADTRVDRLVQTGFNNAANQRAKKTADQQANQMMDRQLIKSGLKPSDYSSLEDKQDAFADMAHEAAQQEKVQKYFHDFKDESKEFTTALRELNQTPDDDSKIQAAGKTKASEMTPQDWTQSDAKVRAARAARWQDLIGRVRLSTGVNMMGGRSQSTETQPPVAASPPLGIAPALSDEDPNLITPPPPPGLTPPALTGDFGSEFTGPAPAAGFSGIQQARQQAGAQKMAEQAALGQRQAALSPQWEIAKNAIASVIDPLAVNAGIPLSPVVLAAKAGKKPDDVAFNDESGKPVTWRDVAQAAISDPRLKGGPALVPVDPKTLALRQKYNY